MSESRAAYRDQETDDPGCPSQFCERLSDSVVRILGVLAEVREYQEQPYWRALESCQEHAAWFVSYQTAQGHLVPFRHSVTDPREVVTWCYLQNQEPRGSGRSE